MSNVSVKSKTGGTHRCNFKRQQLQAYNLAVIGNSYFNFKQELVGKDANGATSTSAATTGLGIAASTRITAIYKQICSSSRCSSRNYFCSKHINLELVGLDLLFYIQQVQEILCDKGIAYFNWNMLDILQVELRYINYYG